MDEFDNLASSAFLKERQKKVNTASYLSFIQHLIVGVPALLVLSTGLVVSQSLLQIKNRLIKGTSSPQSTTSLPEYDAFFTGANRDTPPLQRDQR